MFGAIAGVLGVGQAVLGAVEGRKNRKQEGKQHDAAMQLEYEKMDRAQEIIDKLPAEKQEEFEKVAKAYAQLNTMVEMAKVNGDKLAERNFNDLLQKMKSHATDQMGISAEIFQETEDFIKSSNDEVRGLIEGNVDFRNALTTEYDDQAVLANDFYGRSLDDSMGRYNQLVKGELPEGAAAEMSRLGKRFSDIRQNMEAADAGRNQAGYSGRQMALDIEEAMAEGDLRDRLTKGAADEELDKIRFLEGRRGDLAKDRLLMAGETGDERMAEFEQMENQQMLENVQSRQDRDFGIQSGAGADQINLASRFYDDAESRQAGYDTQKQKDLMGELVSKQGIEDKFDASRINLLNTQSQNMGSLSDRLMDRGDMYGKRADKNMDAVKSGVKMGVGAYGATDGFKKKIDMDQFSRILGY